jgi:prepilin-type N-terminal cleavage/methylation domain-containing protein
MKHGFSLIELIVSVSVIMLITGGVISSYNSYNDKQKIRQAALTVKSHLRLAQASASGSRIPTSSTCSDFIGFTVSGTGTSYTIGPECTEGSGYEEAATTNLANGLTLSLSPASFTFYPLSQGVSSEATMTIASERIGYTCVVTITRIGSVNEICQ